MNLGLTREELERLPGLLRLRLHQSTTPDIADAADVIERVPALLDRVDALTRVVEAVRDFQNPATGLVPQVLAALAVLDGEPGETP